MAKKYGVFPKMVAAVSMLVLCGSFVACGETKEPEPLPEPEKDPYTYEAHLSDKIPRIDVVTADGKNDWATVFVPGFDMENPDNNIKWEYQTCTVSVSGCETDYAFNDVAAQIKVRGNFTTTYEKKPFRIKFDKKQQMLGLNGGAKCKSWVLLADYKDISMSRNSVAFYLGNQLLGSDGYYCSDFRDVELYLNGSYWGVYLLAEQQQVNKSRIDVFEPEEGYTGTDIGYLVEYDGYYKLEKEMERFAIDYGHQKGYAIKNDVYDMAQTQFIRSYVNNVYKICENANRGVFLKFNETYTDVVPSDAQTAYETVSAVIDLPSLVDTLIHAELCCDYDLGWSSFYLNVDMSAEGDKKMRFEAPWDFDSALGIKDACVNATGLYAASSGNAWLELFSGQEWFWKMVWEKWQNAEKFSLKEKTLAFLDELQANNAQAYAKNYERWSYQRVLDSVGGEFSWQAQSKSASQSEAFTYLRNWLERRFSYLDSVWGQHAAEEEPEAGATAYRFELENYPVTGGITVKSGNNASGNGYLGNVAGGAGKTVTVTVTASKAAKAYLYIGLSKRSFPAYLPDWFALNLNGASIPIPMREVPATDTNEWHSWTGVQAAVFNLQKGENVLVLETISGEATNLDYFEIYSVAVLR